MPPAQLACGAAPRTSGACGERELAQLVVRLLAARSPLVELWDEIAARLRLPRLPRHLAEADQVALVAHWLRTLRIERHALFGLECNAAFRLSQLASGCPADWQREVPELSEELLTPELVHTAVQVALLFAPTDSHVAGTMVELATALVAELELRRLPARPLRALRGEVQTALAVVEGLQGAFGRAFELLEAADGLLHTRRRVAEWTRRGRLVAPPSAHLPLRSHGLWLHGRGMIEAAGGHVTYGARCFDLAFELYIAGEAFLGAGLAAVLKASACSWQAQSRSWPSTAVYAVETALELLDLRGLYRLGEALPWDLVVLYARAGLTEQATREWQLLTPGPTLHPVTAAFTEAWVSWATGKRELALAKLLEARQAAPNVAMRRKLSVELAAWELKQQRPGSALTWLQAELADLEDVSPELRQLWRAALAQLTGRQGMEGLLGMGRLQELACAVSRALAFPRVAWSPERAGSLSPHLDLGVKDLEVGDDQA